MERSGIGLEVLDPARLGSLMAASDLKQLHGRIDADDARAPVCQIPSYSSLSTGQIADPLIRDLAHERFNLSDVRILTDRPRDPVIIPLDDVVVGAHRHTLLAMH